jgi:uncharacterized protein (DUF1800 family)
MAFHTLPPLDQLDPIQAWQPWEPTQADPWNLKWAAHLYRRAAFGGSPIELKTAVEKGHAATIDLFVQGEARAKNLENFLDTEGLKVAKRYQPGQFGSREPFELRAWWLYCMLNSGHPLREKMTLFWHNHFATSIAKVRSPVTMFNQNKLLRQYALGKFGPFLLDMSKDAAMLIWLDSNSNVKGHANENYGREIQELFSLGVGHYTEKDIQEAARAFTGWHTDGEGFEFNAGLHDDGDKTFHGVKGSLNGDDVVKIILEQPACAQFLVRKLYRYFISEANDPPTQFVEPLAEQLRKSDYDLGALVRTMISSKHFYSDYAFRRRIKCPVEYVLGAVKSTAEGMISPQPLVRPIDSMGQALFAPPNVKGWPGAQSWLSTATVLARQNFGQALAMGVLWKNGLPQQFDFPQPETVEEDVPEGFPQPGKPGQPKKPGKPEESAPVNGLDPARHIADLKDAAPEKIVDRLLEVYLPGGIGKSAQVKLIAFLGDGKPTGPALDRRVREAVHAIFSMPEYQLA